MKIKTIINLKNPDIIRKAILLNTKYNKNILVREKDLIIGVITLIFGLLSFYQVFKTNFINKYMLFLTIFILFIGCLLIIRNFYGLILPAKFIFKNYIKTNENLQFEATSKEIILTANNVSSKIKWSFFSRALITGEMILLYDSSGEFRILPRASFDDADYNNLLKLMREKLKDIAEKK